MRPHDKQGYSIFNTYTFVMNFLMGTLLLFISTILVFYSADVFAWFKNRYSRKR
jgi:hypothetical protein